VHTRAGQLAGVAIGRNVDTVIERNHFNAAFTASNGNGTLDVRAAIVLDPHV
jgi:hypothetical protein